MMTSRINSLIDYARSLVNGADDATAQRTATVNIGQPTTSLTPTDGEWLDTMLTNSAARRNLTTPQTPLPSNAGSGTAAAAGQADAASQDQPARRYPVVKPPSNDARTLRDTLLREQFGYTDADIRALDTAPDSPGFRISDARTPREWATREQVASWQADAQGRAQITVTDAQAERLRDFLTRGTPSQLRAATANIQDEGVRETVRDSLARLQSSDGNERGNAAIALSQLAQDGKPHAREIRSALQTLSGNPSYATNAALRLSLARVSLEQSQRLTGPYLRSEQFADARRLAADAVMFASGRDVVGEPFSDFTINRSEAARINREAAAIFRATGDEQSAARHERLGRFYEMDATSRQGLNGFGGELIARAKPDAAGETSMRPVSERQQTLVLEGRRVQREIDRVMRESGEREGVDDNELDTKYATPETRITLTQTDERTVFVPNKEGYKKVTKPRYEPYQPNAGGAARGGAVVAKADALNEVGKAANLYRRMRDLPPLYAKQRSLAGELEDEMNYEVPPQPEQLGQMRRGIEMQLGASAQRDPHVRAALDEYMRRVEEESHAFWGR